MISGLDILADHQLVEDQVLEGMSVQGAVALLTSLSPDQAEAVALRVIAGLETPDVAKILGKSAGAVRVALHRGLKSIADDPAVRALAGRVTAAPGPHATVPNAVGPSQSSGRSASQPTLWTLEEVD
jgi:hypothetical protein